MNGADGQGAKPEALADDDPMLKPGAMLSPPQLGHGDLDDIEQNPLVKWQYTGLD